MREALAQPGFHFLRSVVHGAAGTEQLLHPDNPICRSPELASPQRRYSLAPEPAFLATRFTPRHRNLGRRRRGVRAKAFAPDLATVPFLADNLEPEPVCVAYWRRIWVAASAAPQQTATCVLRRLNTEML